MALQLYKILSSYWQGIANDWLELVNTLSLIFFEDCTAVGAVSVFNANVYSATFSV